MMCPSYNYLSSSMHSMIRLPRWRACAICFVQCIPSCTGLRLTHTPWRNLAEEPWVFGALVLTNVCAMANTRRSTRGQDLNAFSTKRSKNADDTSLVPWSNLNHDVLFWIMMQLGVIDFLAFSRVCKAWRSFALSNRNRFMASKEPMSVSISHHAKRRCDLVDFDGKIFKMILPNFAGRFCIGSTCGHLIMFGRKSHDFWLVNPITKHELRFPVLPSYVDLRLADFRAILVFSPSLSRWVFVISFRCSKIILLSSSSESPSWNHLLSDVGIVDLHAFKGKIYAINVNGILGEVRFNPNPKLTLLKINNVPKVPFTYPELLCSSEKLFLLDFTYPNLYVAFELDIEKMEWVLKTETQMEEYALFLSELKCCAIVDPKKWTDPSKHRDMATYFLDLDKNLRGGSFASWVVAFVAERHPKKKRDHTLTSNVWFFPHECYDLNILDE